MKTIIITLISIVSLFADYSPHGTAYQLGMTSTDYSFMMALTGLIMGLIILFAIIYLTLKIGGR